ncbi:DUF1659 domain-containing protein [Desulfotruncus alcoholivorax]|uniref:DUF1659 domain-containing protein n=1 Tax=Desulfotruncus alcoholivorax TaxID=265477 RepID=UPI0004278E32|nr:DUF1659 domain-containing protein [Desulfotruncus alcoholivorax]
MAVNKVIVGTTLRIQFQTGVDGNGNPVYSTKSLNNVKDTAADQDIYDVALALAQLQEYTAESVMRVDYGRLEEAI